MPDNRRYFSRIKLQDEVCQISILDNCFAVQLVDQSIGGACIRGLEMLNVIRGLPVEVEIQNEKHVGRVLNVFRDGDHSLCFGIAWTETEVPCDRVLLNTYVKNGTDFFVCDFREFRGDNVRVSLSGEELDIPRSWILSMTEGQRETQLQDQKIRTMMAKVYGLPARPSVRQVLDFEFSKHTSRVIKQSTWVGETIAQV